MRAQLFSAVRRGAACAIDPESRYAHAQIKKKKCSAGFAVLVSCGLGIHIYIYIHYAATGPAAALGTMPATLPPLPLIQVPTTNGPRQSVSLASQVLPSATSLATATPPAGSAVQSALPVSSATAGAVLLGDGLAPLPTKLVKRIQQLEFVEMADLLCN